MSFETAAPGGEQGRGGRYNAAAPSQLACTSQRARTALGMRVKRGLVAISCSWVILCMQVKGVPPLNTCWVLRTPATPRAPLALRRAAQYHAHTAGSRLAYNRRFKCRLPSYSASYDGALNNGTRAFACLAHQASPLNRCCWLCTHVRCAAIPYVIPGCFHQCKQPSRRLHAGCR